jgi:hypothetical protein
MEMKKVFQLGCLAIAILSRPALAMADSLSPEPAA